MKLYNYEDYKTYLVERIKSMPHGGRGQYQKLSKFLSIGSVVMSQVVRGKRDLSLEQGYLVGKYFGFNDLEQEYFQGLVQLSRSTHLEHKKYLKNKLQMIRKQSQEISNIVPAETLSPEAQSLFYSNWHYSAVRLCASLPKLNTTDQIAKRLNLSTAHVQKITRFLLAHGLLEEGPKGFRRGPTRTQLDADSPFVNRYHASWRAKAMSNMEDLLPHERFLTIPMSLSPKTLAIIREKISLLTEEVFKSLEQTELTTLGCLNIDLFEIKK